MEDWKVFGKFVLMGIVIVLVITVVSWVLWPVGKMVERRVLVESHQYIEGKRQQAEIWTANLAEVDAMLANSQGDEASLKAQQAMLRAQLQSALNVR